jgi:hypothetical protein
MEHEKRIHYLVKKSEGQEPPETSRHNSEDIKVDLREIRCKDVG